MYSESFVPRDRRPASDSGHLQALEAIMVAFVLVGAVLYLTVQPLPGQGPGAEGHQASLLAGDVLRILEGSPGAAPYRSLLHQYATEAVLGDPSNLTRTVARMLPEGADWGFYLDNGEGVEVLHETRPPTGAVQEANFLFYPAWNYVLVFPLLDRQPGTDVVPSSVVLAPAPDAMSLLSLATVPGAPRNLAAASGPAAGEISLAWDPPTSDGGSPLTGYRVYRSTTSEGAYAHVATVTTLLSAPSWKDTGLASGAERWYRVSAVNLIGEGTSSATAGAKAPVTPSAPTAASAVAGPGTGTLTLTWGPPETDGGAAVQSYRVYRATSSGGAYSTVAYVGADVHAWVDTGLANGATRWYRVSALTSVGEGSLTPATSATTFATPGAPQSLVALGGPGAGEITSSWLAPASDGGAAVAEYRVYRALLQTGPWSVVGTTTSTFYTDAGLGDGITRWYRVSATNLAGEGAPSAEAVATTPISLLVASAPGAPQAVAATAGPAAGETTVTWLPPTADGGSPVLEYRVHRAGSATGPFALVATAGPLDLAHVGSGLASGTTYWWRVAAVNSVGEGTPSAAESATTFGVPGAPEAPLATAGPAPGEATLAWLPPATDGGLPVLEYRLWRAETASGPWSLVAATSLLGATDAGLPEGATRWYRLTALNALGEGAAGPAAAVNAFGRPAAPRDLDAASGPGTAEVTLTWSAPSTDGGTPILHYVVHRAEAAEGPYVQVAVVAGVLSWVDAGLPGVEHHYRVSAANLVGAGPWSDLASATPGVAAPEPPEAPAPDIARVGLRVRVVPVRNSFLDRDVAGDLVFENGARFALARDATGLLASGAVPPEDLDRANGFAVPYDRSSPEGYAVSIAEAAARPPVGFGIATTLPYRTVPAKYDVHPQFVVDQALQTFLEDGERVRPAGSARTAPGGTATVSYDYAGMPLAPGWSVVGREIVVYGPVLGNVVAREDLASATGTWSWKVPRQALYGTYVVEVRHTLGNGNLAQTSHDVTAFEVLRRGVDGPVPPVYRAVLAIWFEGMS